MKNRPTGRALALALVAALALASCGKKHDTAAPASAAGASSQPSSAGTAAPAGGAVIVKVAASPFGKILVDGTGRTLYGFKNDVNHASTCVGVCAKAWPPVLAPTGWQAATDVDTAVLSTTTRPDGQPQLTAGLWPLYTFANDSGPGQYSGEGSAGAWFVVGADAKLIEKPGGGTSPFGGSGPSDQAPPATPGSTGPAKLGGTTQTSLGAVLTDADGLTLYGFTPDDGKAQTTCVGACAKAWPPVSLTALPTGLDPKQFSLVPGPGATQQLKVGKWYAFTYSGDGKPGDVAGEGIGGKWFALDPTGKLIKQGGGAPSPSGTPPTTTGATGY